MTEKNSENYDQFEGRLSYLLTPVSPNPQFIQKLEKRLTNRNRISIEQRKKSYAFVILGLGLFFGALIIWIIDSIND